MQVFYLLSFFSPVTVEFCFQIDKERLAMVQRLAMMSIVTPAMIISSGDENTREVDSRSGCQSAAQSV